MVGTSYMVRKHFVLVLVGLPFWGLDVEDGEEQVQQPLGQDAVDVEGAEGVDDAEDVADAEGVEEEVLPDSSSSTS